MDFANTDTSQVEIIFNGIGTYRVKPGTLIGDLCDDLLKDWPYTIVAVIIDNTLRDLHYNLEEDCSVDIVDTSMDAGLRIYRRSASFLLIKACRDLFPQRILMIKHTLSNGLFCEFLEEGCTDEEIEQIKTRMQQLIDRDLPIHKYLVKKEEARRVF